MKLVNVLGFYRSAGLSDLVRVGRRSGLRLDSLKLDWAWPRLTGSNDAIRMH